MRSSSYGTYSFCPMQYYLGYVLGHLQDSNKAAEKGTIVHKVMEILANHNLNKDIEYKELWSDKYVDSLVEEWYGYYRDKSAVIDKFKPADYRDCLKWTHMELDYNNGQFDPRKRDILTVEGKFDIPIEEPWAYYGYELPNGDRVEGQLSIKGTIDLVTKDNGNLEAIDYKTGQRKDWATGAVKTYSYLQNDAQLLLYHYALSHMYPEYDCAIMTIFFIRDGGPFSLCLCKEDNKRFLHKLEKRVEEIKNCVSPKMLSNRQTHFKCQRMCHFYKNKFHTDSKDNMCMETKKSIQSIGMEATTAKLTKPNFSINYYHSPGS